MRRASIALLGAAFVFASCANQGAGPGSTSVARPRSTATLEIVEPQPGDTISSPVTVRLRLTGGRISKKVTRNLEPDVGHIHLRVDGKTITLLGSLAEHVKMKKGLHVLETEFVASDHGPFQPRVLKSVSVTVG